MLDNDTKRRIDTARDILVGKVPDPKSQVEQITIALIYKFMDDMDKEALDFGGEATFFTGEFEKYSWAKIFDPKIGGHEMLNLYGEAILMLNQNPNIPQLFRDIFKNAYLPYRDPETLKMFLKNINDFKYDHSEMLGDAFEYLLSVLGSQGDAGQFRTPRHIIDFMVKILEPRKGESICDPACGTAGFLISSYKYIVDQNTKKSRGDLLTPDDRKRLMLQLTGYDISPDMVRLSLVNMYLHGFSTPKIYEYDTLTSEERWNEHFDIVMANPPFMTPKGGIKPHKKFTVQATKSEVLFTDYITEHINPTTGRAAIIVPNGIIATTQNAYKQLRKFMVENSLIAVISLPAGVFQPYSGVKTSILILDKRLSKKSKHVLFLKIENDGFDLGAQRRTIVNNDLPLAFEIFSAYKKALECGVDFDVNKYSDLSLLVEKDKVLENKDVVLNGDRYLESKVNQTDFNIVRLGDYFELYNGFAFDSSNISNQSNEDSIPIVKIGNVIHSGDLKMNNEFVSYSQHKDKKNSIFIGSKFDVFIALSGATTGKISKLPNDFVGKYFALNQRVALVKSKTNIASTEFLYYLLLNGGIYESLLNLAHGAAQPNLSSKQIAELEIPLPPHEIQQQIIAEIYDYQKIIDGAKQVINNYKPNIAIKPEWELVELGSVASFKNGLNYTKNDIGNSIKMIGVGDFKNYLFPKIKNLQSVSINERISSELLLQKNDLLFVRSNGNKDLVGRCIIIPSLSEEISFSGFSIRLRFNDNFYLPIFYCYLFRTDFFRKILSGKEGANISNISQERLREVKIPHPSIDEQTDIVERIEEEQKLVNANKKLIEIFEQKIKDKINEVWGVKEEKIYEIPEVELSMVAEDDY